MVKLRQKKSGIYFDFHGIIYFIEAERFKYYASRSLLSLSNLTDEEIGPKEKK